MTAGEIICIVGPTGCGKSMLISGIAGTEERSTGRLFVDGVAIAANDPRWLESRTLVPQEPELIPGILEDNLKFFPGWRGSDRISKAAEDIISWIGKGVVCGTTEDGSGVSVGQRRTIAFLRGLGSGTPGLLLDEPIAGVDKTLVPMIREALLEARSEGRIILLASHTHDLARLGLEGVSVVSLPSEA